MYAEFYRLGQAHGIAAVVLSDKLKQEGWTPQQIEGVMNLLSNHRTLMAQAYVSLLEQEKQEPSAPPPTGASA